MYRAAQGIDRYAKRLLPSTMGTGRRSSTIGEVIGNYFDFFGPFLLQLLRAKLRIAKKNQTLHFFCSKRLPLKQNVITTNRKLIVLSFDCAIARVYWNWHCAIVYFWKYPFPAFVCKIGKNGIDGLQKRAPKKLVECPLFLRWTALDSRSKTPSL